MRDDEHFYHFSRGRFVCNELHETTQRVVQFNLHELQFAAARAVGSTSCVHVEKCAEGMYNKRSC